MKNRLQEAATRFQRTFATFTTGQKITAIVGTLGLLIAGGMLFRWASAPNYGTLFADLAPADASSVVDKLNSDGVPYKLENGGRTVMVPQDQVYDERIKLSGAGLPSDSSQGYGLLDNMDISTSQSQEAMTYKRAIEGELESTIGAIDGINTATVLLALPEKSVFTDSSSKPTASVMLDTGMGSTLSSEQVQAVVHLVASAVDDLAPNDVTVTDSQGNVLSSSDETMLAGADGRTALETSYQTHLQANIQSMLDQVYGPGNSIVRVSPTLDLDATETDTKTYVYDKDIPPLSVAKSEEKYTSPNGANPVTGGTVGPNGELSQIPGTATGDSTYSNTQESQDNPVGTVIEHRKATPGDVTSVNVSVVVDSQKVPGFDPQKTQEMVTNALPVKSKDASISVTDAPFDRTAELAATKAAAAEKKAADKAGMMSMVKTGGLVAVVLIVLVMVFLSNRKRNKMRQEATRYVVEQIRTDQISRQETAALETPGYLEIEGNGVPDEDAAARQEIAALIERQPEEVAQLLRGWLVETSS